MKANNFQFGGVLMTCSSRLFRAVWIIIMPEKANSNTLVIPIVLPVLFVLLLSTVNVHARCSVLYVKVKDMYSEMDMSGNSVAVLVRKSGNRSAWKRVGTYKSTKKSPRRYGIIVDFEGCKTTNKGPYFSRRVHFSKFTHVDVKLLAPGYKPCVARNLSYRTSLNDLVFWMEPEKRVAVSVQVKEDGGTKPTPERPIVFPQETEPEPEKRVYMSGGQPITVYNGSPHEVCISDVPELRESCPNRTNGRGVLPNTEDYVYLPLRGQLLFVYAYDCGWKTIHRFRPSERNYTTLDIYVKRVGGEICKRQFDVKVISIPPIRAVDEVKF